MITKEDVREVFDSAEATFEFCWTVLAELKENRNITHDDIIDFQPKLANELFQVDKLYHDLNQEKNEYISRKQSLSTFWFENRLKKISEYQRGLKGLLSTGLMLGDSFAWIFYYKNRKQISKHYEQKLNIHFPPGIGGKGELEFIRNIPVIHNHIVIYHEITTFLRLGDISLINMEDFSLTAIGELKSTTEDGEVVHINFTAISGGKEKYEILENDLNAFNNQIPLAENEPERKMPHKVRQRLERQIKEIGTSLSDEKEIPNESIKSKNNLIEEVLILSNEVISDHYSIKKIDRGLLLSGFKNNKKSLYSKFLKPVSSNYSKVLNDYAEEVLTILKKDSPHNYIYLYEPFKPNKYYLEPGMVPLFHWPFDLDIIKALIFQQINLISTYNPVNLIERLEKEGFDFKKIPERKDGFEITKKLDDERLIKIEMFAHLLRLIGFHFFSEESIFEMVFKFDKRNEALFKEKKEPYGINMYVTQNFGESP